MTKLAVKITLILICFVMFFFVNLSSCSCSQELQGTSQEFDTDEGRTDAGDSMSIQTGTTGPISRR